MKLLIGFVIAFVACAIYACLVIAARKDEEAEYQYQKMQLEKEEKNSEEEDK